MKMKTMFLNADKGEIAKAILAGCHKFYAATLLRRGGATMTSVIEIYDDDEESDTIHGQD